MPSEHLPPYSLGLWGDGDEISALQDVEQHFDVQLDYADSETWITVGDVYSALQRKLPDARGEDAATWHEFVKALSQETGVNPADVRPETELLGSRRLTWRDKLILAAIGAVVLTTLLQLNS